MRRWRRRSMTLTAESRVALVRCATCPRPANYRQPDYRQAQFLAHLIAMKDQHPQTRERRRAEPGEAIAAYRAAAGPLT